MPLELRARLMELPKQPGKATDLLELSVGHAHADLPARVDLLERDGRLQAHVQLQVLAMQEPGSVACI